MDASPVELVEVGPRDGLQSIDDFVPTDEKVALIRALRDAGYRRIEIGSFVSPRAVPQMADIEAVVRAVAGLAGLRASVLVPNLRGAEQAAAAGVAEIVYVCSASQTHNQKNVRRTVEQSLDELARVVAGVTAPDGIKLRFSVSTAFDCPFEGPTPKAKVLALIERVLALDPAAELCLCDTNGKATPDQVERLFRACQARFPHPRVAWVFHGHDTYGMGVANAVAAYRSGVRIFDGSIAGLGGCPFAPGATGNVASEDLVYLFERMGCRTGIDLTALLPAALRAAALPGASVGGRVRTAISMRQRRAEGEANAAVAQ